MFHTRAIRILSVFLLLLSPFISIPALAATAHLAWDPAPDEDVQGYRIYYGTLPSQYTNSVDVGNVTDYVLTDLSDCTRYFFAAKAYDTSGNVSQGFSNEVVGLTDPSIVSVLPVAAERGQALTVTVNGSNFDQGANVVFSGRINVYSTNFVWCHQLRATISIPGDAMLGAQSASVLNPDGSSGTLGSAFQVLAVTVPLVTGVSPAPGSRAVPITVHPSVMFSERMNPLTITPSTVVLLRQDGSAVSQAPGSPSLDATGKIATIVPDIDLQYGTLYRIKILGGALGVRDNQGTPMVTTIIYGQGFLTVEGLSSDEPPIVVETIPAASAADVPTDVRPAVTFSKTMDPLTLTPDRVQLLAADGTPVVQDESSPMLDFTGRVAVIVPAQPFEYGASYFLRVTGGADGVRDDQGISMAADYEQAPAFSTPAAPDTQPPSVVFTDPPDGAADVPVDGLLDIAFSEPMDPSTLTTSTVLLLNAMDEAVAQAEGSPVMDVSRRTVTIIPAQRLRYGTAYHLRTLGGPGGVHDAHGNPMEGDYEQPQGFMTRLRPDAGAPSVVSTNPANGDVGVPLDVRPTLTFNEPMDPTSITVNTVRILDSQGQPIAQADGSPVLEASGTIVTLVPAVLLEHGMIYHLEVVGGDGGVLDAEGTAMNGGFVQTSGFTVTAADTDGPTVIWTDPEEGDGHVDRHVRPRVYFNEALDPETITPLTVVLIGPGGDVVEQDHDSPSLDDTGTIVRITLRRELRGHTDYRLQVIGGTEGVRDLAGNPMRSTYTMVDGFETK